MKESDVEGILHRHGYVFQEHATIYATLKPGVAAYQIGLKQTMFSNKEHLLHVNEKGIIILVLDEMSGTILEDSIVLLPLEDIQQVEIIPKSFAFRLVIRTKQGDLEYNIRKTTLGAPWHKHNLIYFLHAFEVSS